MLHRAIAGITLALLSLGASAASFTPLGSLGSGTGSGAADLSADGTVVVGTSAGQAFRWTAGAMTSLGANSSAVAVSGDGSVVVGTSAGQAFRWTSGGGLVGLGDLPGGAFASSAAGVSANGTVVVGTGRIDEYVGSCARYCGGDAAFIWTSGAGMVQVFPGTAIDQGGGLGSVATAVSGDGSMLGGIIWAADATSRNAFRWSGSIGWAGQNGSRITSISPDGSIMVGVTAWGGGTEVPRPTIPFRWSASGGFEEFFTGLFQTNYDADNLPEVWFNDLSADGTVIVGSLLGEAALFNAAGDPQLLLDVLLAQGATGLEGWVLKSAVAVSADGHWIVGNGLNPNGVEEAFLAGIQAVPLPATLWLGLAGAGLLLPWTRRRRLGEHPR